MIFLSAERVAKRLELLRELVPRAARVALLINPDGPTPEITLRDAQLGAQAMGLQMQVCFGPAPAGRSMRRFRGAGARAARRALRRIRSLFTTPRVQLINLASRHGLPASYSNRQFAIVGGLITYGTNPSAGPRSVFGYVLDATIRDEPDQGHQNVDRI